MNNKKKEKENRSENGSGNENGEKLKCKEVNMKTIKFILQKSEELEKKQLLTSFFCLLYVVEKLNLYVRKKDSDKEAKELFINCLTKAEKIRPTFSKLDEGELAKFCNTLFAVADKNDRTQEFTKKTLQLFFTSQIFYEILDHFKTLDEDEKKKYVYAKYKTVYLKKCLDNNITPRPGTPVDDKDTNGSQNVANDRNSIFEETQEYENGQNEITSQIINRNSLSVKEETTLSDYKEFEPFPKREDASIDFASSLKHAQYAVNALMFEDKETAIQQLNMSLSYLKG